MDQLDSVCPIFCQNGDDFYQVGSGALIEFRGLIFLLTAAHVIDELEHGDLLVPHADGTIRSIEGSYSFNKASEYQIRSQDFLDYGYFKLDDNFARSLRKYFYIVKECQLGVKQQYDEKELFSFTGYPHRKSNVAGTTAKTDFYAYGTYHASLAEYTELGFRPDANIVAKFNRKITFNPAAGRVELPVLPHGISGGGIFVWPQVMTKIPPDDRRLVGIGHTWKKAGYFVGTRIEILLEAILRNNPSLR